MNVDLFCLPPGTEVAPMTTVAGAMMIADHRPASMWRDCAEIAKAVAGGSPP